MSSNKTGKYLKYAIGEIILVMIGILLALQVNNWNEQRKDRIIEQGVLLQLKEDYLSNLNQLVQKIAMRTSIIRSGFKILDYFDNPNSTNKDSLIVFLADLLHDPTFDPVQNDLIASGNMRLIQNKKLKRLLSNWSSEVVGLQEFEQIWSKLAAEQYQPIVSSLGLTRNMLNIIWNDDNQNWLLDKAEKVSMSFGKSKMEVSIFDITNNKEIEGIVSQSISYSQAGNLQSFTLKKRIEEILESIESEIE